MKKPLVIAGLILLIILLGLFVFVSLFRSDAPGLEQNATQSPEQAITSRDNTFSNEEASTEALEELPDVNPYERTETNPFEKAETNPFKDAYTNPFE